MNPVVAPSADPDLEVRIIVSVTSTIDIVYLHNLQDLPNFGIEDIACT